MCTFLNKELSDGVQFEHEPLRFDIRIRSSNKESILMSKDTRTKHSVRTPINWFPIVVSFLVVAVVVAIGFIVVAQNRAALAVVKTPASALINQETGAIELGSGPNLFVEYLDFGCAACKEWHMSNSSYVSRLVEEGEITLALHPIGILDPVFQGSEYSTRAAAATYCVAQANPDAVYGFMDLLFKKQPMPGTPGLDNEKLVEYAKRAEAPQAEDCIMNEESFDFIRKQTLLTPIKPELEGISTPTLMLNGEFVSNTDPFIDLVPIKR